MDDNQMKSKMIDVEDIHPRRNLQYNSIMLQTRSNYNVVLKMRHEFLKYRLT